MRSCIAALASLAAAAALAAPAGAAPVSFRGSCKFGGPITPEPPITLIPRPHPHFDYAGTGTCGGAPATLSFQHVSTLFDTCELGPDFPLKGTMTIGASTFAVTVDLVRLALAGPLALSTAGGGLGVGVASFNPGNPTTALLRCLTTGVAAASLSAHFTTLRPLIGS